MNSLKNALAERGGFGLGFSEPPSNDEWNEFGRLYLPISRLGYESIQKTREEYIAALVKEDIPDEFIENFIADLLTFREGMKDIVSLLETAIDHGMDALDDLRLHRAQGSKD